MININAAKELVKMYDNLTLEDFEREWHDEMCGSNVLQTFTGFGSPKKCLLCKEAKALRDRFEEDMCNHCIYGEHFGCVIAPYYLAICDSCSPEELLRAVHDRSNYIKTLIKELEENLNNAANESEK